MSTTDTRMEAECFSSAINSKSFRPLVAVYWSGNFISASRRAMVVFPTLWSPQSKTLTGSTRLFMVVARRINLPLVTKYSSSNKPTISIGLINVSCYRRGKTVTIYARRRLTSLLVKVDPINTLDVDLRSLFRICSQFEPRVQQPKRSYLEI